MQIFRFYYTRMGEVSLISLKIDQRNEALKILLLVFV